MDAQLLARLRAIEGVTVLAGAALSGYTRFGIGGPADAVVEAFTERSMIEALGVVGETGVALEVIGEGSNLIVADGGFRGVVLRYRGNRIAIDASTGRAEAAAGVVLQTLVDETIAQGLAGVHTMTGIPGSVGAAVYGNAGAYGRSISQSVERVSYFDGERVVTVENAECGFQYRESIFKRHKQWIILSVVLRLEVGEGDELRARADEIRKVRDEKYPPSMRCAGSIFKNLIFNELTERVKAEVPPRLVREGKVPAAWFLEEAGVKGMRVGGIQVAEYHANLIYNAGAGTASELKTVIENCKNRVCERFGGLGLEEEVQYVGF